MEEVTALPLVRRFGGIRRAAVKRVRRAIEAPAESRQEGALETPIARVLKRAGAILSGLAWNLASLALALGIWQLVCVGISPDLPTPLSTLQTLLALLSDPWSTDLNSYGIGRQVGASMGRVAIGFTLSALVAVPIGILIAVSPVARKLIDPIVQMLRPVSPLVWFPLSLVAFKAMGGTSSATLFTVFITGVWPTLINTAFGVSSLPQDYRTVARVFHFSRTRFLRKIVLPFAFPHILTGLRLSMGNAWLVIVAAEMLSGGTGIGFFAWDSYNAGSYEKMVVAVMAIGAVGLGIDRGFAAIHRRFDYTGGTS